MLRGLMANGFAVSLSIILLWHFGLIAIYGRVNIGEPSVLVLVIEIVTLLGILIFCVVNIITLLRRVQRG